MAHMNMSAMQNLFRMYSALKDEVDSLKAEVKALRESSNKRHVAVKEVVNFLSVEVEKSLDENDEKVDQLSAEIEEVREHVIVL